MIEAHIQNRLLYASVAQKRELGMRLIVKNLLSSLKLSCLLLTVTTAGCDGGGSAANTVGNPIKFGVNNSWESEDGSSYSMGGGVQSEIDTNRDSVTDSDGGEVVFRAFNQVSRPFSAVVDFRDKSIVFTFEDGEVRAGSILCDIEPNVEQDIFERCFEASMFVEGATGNPYTKVN